MEEVYIDEPLIFTSKNIYILKEMPVLDNGQVYIYAMLNYPQGHIKIGKTTNIVQRLQSLSGSNSGGNRIVKLYCSPATWLHSMETALHSYYGKYRIDGTEWFKGKVDFEDVVKHINSLFYTRQYQICNELRKSVIEKERIRAEKANEINGSIKETSKKSKGKKK